MGFHRAQSHRGAGGPTGLLTARVFIVRLGSHGAAGSPYRAARGPHMAVRGPYRTHRGPHGAIRSPHRVVRSP